MTRPEFPIIFLFDSPAPFSPKPVKDFYQPPFGAPVG